MPTREPRLDTRPGTGAAQPPPQRLHVPRGFLTSDDEEEEDQLRHPLAAELHARELRTGSPTSASSGSPSSQAFRGEPHAGGPLERRLAKEEENAVALAQALVAAEEALEHALRDRDALGGALRKAQAGEGGLRSTDASRAEAQRMQVLESRLEDLVRSEGAQAAKAMDAMEARQAAAAQAEKNKKALAAVEEENVTLRHELKALQQQCNDGAGRGEALAAMERENDALQQELKALQLQSETSVRSGSSASRREVEQLRSELAAAQQRQEAQANEFVASLLELQRQLRRLQRLAEDDQAYQTLAAELQRRNVAILHSAQALS